MMIAAAADDDSETQRQLSTIRELVARGTKLCDRRYGRDALIGGSSPESLVRALSSDLCTSLVKAAFPQAHVRRHACAAGCGASATERCHGVPRPALLLRAASQLWPEAEETLDGVRRLVRLADLTAAFLALHGDGEVGFCFKCAACHALETRRSSSSSSSTTTTEA
jgi:hypothetical protein